MLWLEFLGLIFSLFSILAYYKIRHSKEKVEFIYVWASPIGAFVWEDLLIFSLYGLVVTLVTIFIKDLRVGLLFFVVFWIIRSAGEILYFFFQQFSNAPTHPHDIKGHFKILRFIFGDISDQKCFIVMQVFFQVILVTFVTLLILLLQNWKFMDKWY